MNAILIIMILLAKLTPNIMRIFRINIILLFSFFFLVSCKMDENEDGPKKKHPQVNFIVLVDLSDRIILSNDQVRRDINIIENIYSLFQKEVQKKVYVRSKDQFKIIIAEQKNSKINNTIYEDKFYVNLENEKIATKKKIVKEVSKNLIKNLNQLYQNARFSSNPDEYSGADIWKYFNEDLESDLINSPDAKNIVIVISDGQLIVNGRDRVVANQSIRRVYKSFNNLSVAMVEIITDDIDNGYSQLSKSWKDWFDSMKIYNSYFDKKVSLKNVNDGLKNFILSTINNEGDFKKKINNSPIVGEKKNTVKKTVYFKKANINNNVFKVINKNNNSSYFNRYKSILTLDQKTNFTIKYIIDFNEEKYKTSELKIIASDLYYVLLHDFPNKNEITKFSYCCSSKEKILKFLKKYYIDTKEIEENFKTNCP